MRLQTNEPKQPQQPLDSHLQLLIVVGVCNVLKALPPRGPPNVNHPQTSDSITPYQCRGGTLASKGVVQSALLR